MRKTPGAISVPLQMGKILPLGVLTMNAPVFEKAFVVSTKPYTIALTRAGRGRAARITTGMVHLKNRMGTS